MGTNNILAGGVVGGIVSLLAGYLIWGIGLESMVADSPMGSMMLETPNFLWLGLGCLAGGLLVSYIFAKWASISTAMGGMQGGAIMGLLLGLNQTLIMLGTSTATTLNLAIVDTIAFTVMYALVGAAVGWTLGRTKKALQPA